MAACFHRLCGRQFAGQAAFDRHLRMLRVPPWVECRDPAELGMVLGDRGWSTGGGAPTSLRRGIS